MLAKNKVRCFWAAAALSGLAALLLGALGTHLVGFGAYPPDGNGSLGHLGDIIAGIAALFSALTLALIGLYFVTKTRPVSPQRSAIPPA